MTQAIAQGDVVMLKSGGPRMTVKAFLQNSATTVVCEWFDNKEHKSGTFAVTSLEKA